MTSLDCTRVPIKERVDEKCKLSTSLIILSSNTMPLMVIRRGPGEKIEQRNKNQPISTITIHFSRSESQRLVEKITCICTVTLTNQQGSTILHFTCKEINSNNNNNNDFTKKERVVISLLRSLTCPVVPRLSQLI